MSSVQDWKTTNFGEIAEQIVDRIDNPEDTDLVDYIGLEHIESGNLKIHIYGKAADVVSSKFVCRKGDIIFSRRRAYLRKLAISDRDALVSTDAMVIRPKAGFLKEFLVLTMQTDRFWNEVISRSAGSLSPRIKWRDLSRIHVALPPTNVQEKISELIFCLQDNLEKAENLIQIAEKLRKSLLEGLLTKGIGHKRFTKTELGEIPEEWSIVSLGEICEERKDKAYPPYEKQKYVSLEQMHSGDLIQNAFAESQSVKSVTNKFLAGDMLYGKLRPNLNKAAIANFDGICTTEILVINSKPNTSNNYLLLHFKSKPFVEYNSNCAYGTKMPRTSFEILSKYKIPIGSVEEQNRILRVINSLNTFESNCRKQTEEIANLEKKLTNLFLSGELLIPKGDMS